MYRLRLASIVVSGLFVAGQAFGQKVIKGQVLGGGGPISNSTVTLWEASGDAPKQLAKTKTNADGRFQVNGRASSNGTSMYLLARGGVPRGKSSDDPHLVLLAVLGNKP